MDEGVGVGDRWDVVGQGGRIERIMLDIISSIGEWGSSLCVCVMILPHSNNWAGNFIFIDFGREVQLRLGGAEKAQPTSQQKLGSA